MSRSWQEVRWDALHGMDHQVAHRQEVRILFHSLHHFGNQPGHDNWPTKI
jgi:hypothetical protein